MSNTTTAPTPTSSARRRRRSSAPASASIHAPASDPDGKDRGGSHGIIHRVVCWWIFFSRAALPAQSSTAIEQSQQTSSPVCAHRYVISGLLFSSFVADSESSHTSSIRLQRSDGWPPRSRLPAARSHDAVLEHYTAPTPTFGDLRRPLQSRRAAAACSTEPITSTRSPPWTGSAPGPSWWRPNSTRSSTSSTCSRSIRSS